MTFMQACIRANSRFAKTGKAQYVYADDTGYLILTLSEADRLFGELDALYAIPA